jgi:hypothetical protein
MVFNCELPIFAHHRNLEFLVTKPFFTSLLSAQLAKNIEEG